MATPPVFSDFISDFVDQGVTDDPRDAFRGLRAAYAREVLDWVATRDATVVVQELHTVDHESSTRIRTLFPEDRHPGLDLLLHEFRFKAGESQVQVTIDFFKAGTKRSGQLAADRAADSLAWLLVRPCNGYWVPPRAFLPSAPAGSAVYLAKVQPTADQRAELQASGEALSRLMTTTSVDGQVRSRDGEIRTALGRRVQIANAVLDGALATNLLAQQALIQAIGGVNPAADYQERLAEIIMRPLVSGF